MRHSRKSIKLSATWLLLLLAWVSVLAPVWADVYQCPMAKAAEQEESSCCSKVAPQGMPPPAVVGTHQYQEACDCPQVHWDAVGVEQVRETRTTFEPAQLVAILNIVWTMWQPVREKALPIALIPSGQGDRPPLWIWNQAILC